jgi:hypothetical protein
MRLDRSRKGSGYSRYLRIGKMRFHPKTYVTILQVLDGFGILVRKD